MSPTLGVVLWWVAFAGAHLVLSSLPIRSRLAATIGETAFRSAYSLLMIVLFVPLVRSYFVHRHAGDVLWTLPPSALLRWLLYGAIGLAFVLVVGSFMTPSPATVVPGAARPRGVLRITRHPFFMGTALWALAHLLANGTTIAVAFFGGFFVFPLVGAMHQDARKLATNPRYAEFYAATSFLPFARGGIGPAIREMAPAAAIGVLVTVVVRYFHASWFGG
jgi:uncharacterized membrane protein